MTKKKNTEVPSEPKERGPNATSFSAERPNPTAFPPGVSGNPGGAPRHFRALARALRVSGAGRAPDAECDMLGLPRGSSKVQVMAERILWTARRGSPTEQLQAAELFARLTGEYTNRLTLGVDPDFEGEGDEFAPGPRLVVQFVSSEYDLAREAAQGKFIDHKPSRDIDPAAAAAQAEAERAANDPSERSLEPSSQAEPKAPAPKQLSNSNPAQPAPYRVPNSWRAP